MAIPMEAMEVMESIHQNQFHPLPIGPATIKATPPRFIITKTVTATSHLLTFLLLLLLKASYLPWQSFERLYLGDFDVHF